MGSHRSKTRVTGIVAANGFVAIWDHTVLKQDDRELVGSFGFVAIWDHTVLKPVKL